MPEPADHPTLAASTWPCLRAHGAELILDVSVSPNARKTELVGWHDGALRVRVQAPPVEGAANEALRKWLARELDMSVSQVRLVRGDTSRRKQFALSGPVTAVIAWLTHQPALRKAAPSSDKD